MALKELQKKIELFFISKNERADLTRSVNKLALIIYPLIILLSFFIYTTTYNYLNDKKSHNDKNLENFFNTDEFVDLKKSLFAIFKSPYIEFNYKIENND